MDVSIENFSTYQEYFAYIAGVLGTGRRYFVTTPRLPERIARSRFNFSSFWSSAKCGGML